MKKLESGEKMLTKKELERYSRQIVFPRIREKGQEKLKQSKLAILGLGGIGSAAALYLASAGVGYIKLIDRDFVELGNIHRQILYNEADVEEYKPKAIASKEKLQKMNTNIVIEAVVEDFNPLTAERMVMDVDMILDCVDNAETRFLLNEVCVKHEKPFIHGAAIGGTGIVTTIIPGKTPCLKCVYQKIPEPDAIPTCEVAGVMGPAPGLVGTIEAMEAIKYLVGFGNLLESKFLYVDISLLDFGIDEFEKDPNCLVCVKREFPLLTKPMKRVAITTLCGRNAVQVTPKKTLGLNLEKLANELKRNPEIKIEKMTPYLLAINCGKYPVMISPSGRTLIKNTKSQEEAKSVFNRIIRL